MQRQSKNNAMRAPKLRYEFPFFAPCTRGLVSEVACDFVPPQAGSTALGIHSADSNALKMAF
jgi:hypothetical protein